MLGGGNEPPSDRAIRATANPVVTHPADGPGLLRAWSLLLEEADEESTQVTSLRRGQSGKPMAEHGLSSFEGLSERRRPCGREAEPDGPQVRGIGIALDQAIVLQAPHQAHYRGVFLPDRPPELIDRLSRPVAHRQESGSRALASAQEAGEVRAERIGDGDRQGAEEVGGPTVWWGGGHGRSDRRQIQYM